MNNQTNITPNEYMNIVTRNAGASNKQIAEELSKTFIGSLRDITDEMYFQIEVLTSLLTERAAEGRVAFKDVASNLAENKDQIAGIATDYAETVQEQFQMVLAAVSRIIASEKEQEEVVNASVYLTPILT